MANYPGVRTFAGGDTLLASHLNELWTALQSLFPVGFLMYSVASATSSENYINTAWLECNGASVLRATYPSLNTLLSGLSYPFGTVDGTHFTLPDYRGRAPYGMGSSGANADVDALGDSDGAAHATRSPKHNTTRGTLATSSTSAGTPSGSVGISDPGHTHTGGADVGRVTPGAGTDIGVALNITTSVTGSRTTGITGSFTGSSMSTHSHTISSGAAGPGGTRPDDMPSYLVAGCWFIKAVA